ncbi:MAG: hypothetical protein FD153_1560 [Rhodospirillaceae bacterium]|nr:MAG: hypothetical protein FD153_1560 [Rhodospirillaceae bacterium]
MASPPMVFMAVLTMALAVRINAVEAEAEHVAPYRWALPVTPTPGETPARAADVRWRSNNAGMAFKPGLVQERRGQSESFHARVNRPWEPAEASVSPPEREPHLAEILATTLPPLPFLAGKGNRRSHAFVPHDPARYMAREGKLPPAYSADHRLASSRSVIPSRVTGQRFRNSCYHDAAAFYPPVFLIPSGVP